MKNKKLILGIAGFAVFLGLVYAAYNGLTEEYKDQINGSGNSAVPNNDEGSSSEKQKNKAPDFTVYDEDMNEVKLSDFEGTPVVLNFWATWCGYCKDEMPYFQKASENFSEEQVKILMINMTDGRSETKEKAIEYMKNNNYKINLLLDIDQEVANGYRVSGIPRTIFIDKDGYIREDKVGKIDADTLNTMIEELVNE
ncbi:TlpA family protein disulfide reductase [Clostridium culturomicium]|uniref:TlpA family protein disulfide reductase n=1 Tax=Clostridium culturomicium TaxID=1499683 RepID=UPI00058F9C83|nr:TlpA disulfide reductase family protein [Clostridium culturomicium]